MHEIRQLEEEWLKYHRKKRRPWYILSAILFLVLLIVLFVMNNYYIKEDFFSKDVFSQTNLSKENVVLPKMQDKSFALLNGPLKHIDVMEIVHQESAKVTQSTSVSSEISSSDTLVDIPILDDKGNAIEHEKIQDEKKKVHLDIQETTSISAYEDVEKRFMQSQDIDDALFLAKSYYKKGAYKKSEHWALEANRIDPNLEESVLIFVKSKMKQGNKNEALAILKQYIQKNDSEDAKVLLKKIQNDRF